MFRCWRKAPCCGCICGLTGDLRLCGGGGPFICGEKGPLKPCTLIPGHGLAETGEKLWKKAGLMVDGMPG